MHEEADGEGDVETPLRLNLGRLHGWGRSGGGLEEVERRPATGRPQGAVVSCSQSPEHTITSMTDSYHHHHYCKNNNNMNWYCCY